MKLLSALALAISLAIPSAAQYTKGPTISTNTGTMSQSIAGTYSLAASSLTISTPTITLAGQTGLVTAVAFKGSGSSLTGVGFGAGFVDVTGPPYNAKTDGSTDDTTAIKAAIAATPVDGTVYFPCGFYPVSSALVINKQINIKGNGSCSQIYQTSTSTDLFQLNGGQFGLEFVNMSDMWLASSSTLVNTSVVYLQTVNYSHFTNIILSGGYYGIWLHGSIADTFDKIQSANTVSDGGFHVNVPDNKGAWIYLDADLALATPESSNANTFLGLALEAGTTGFMQNDQQNQGGFSLLGGTIEGQQSYGMILRTGAGPAFISGLDMEQTGLGDHKGGMLIEARPHVSIFSSSIDTMTVHSSNSLAVHDSSLGQPPVISTDSFNVSLYNTQLQFTANVVPLYIAGPWQSAVALSSQTFQQITLGYPITGITMAGTIQTSSPTISGDNNLKTFHGLTAFGDFNTDTGNVVIQTNVPMGSRFFSVHIQGYDSALGAFDLTIGAATFTTPRFDDYGYINTGTFKPAVTLGKTAGGKMAIILGTNSSVWTIPTINVTEFVEAGNPLFADGQGWTTSIVTSTTAYANQATINDVTLSAAATALATAPNQCPAGQFPIGIDVNGNALSCTTPAEAKTFTSSKTFTSNVLISSSAIITSTLTIQGSAFSVGVSSFIVAGGSATLAYQFGPGSISMTGSSGTFTNQSSVTASAFFGSGASLTGIPSTGSITNLLSVKASSGVNADITSLSGLNTIFMAAGSTISTGGGLLNVSTAANGSSHNLQINSLGGVYLNGNGLDAVNLSTYILNATSLPESSFAVAHTSTTGAGVRTDGFVFYNSRTFEIGNYQMAPAASIFTLYSASGTYSTPAVWQSAPQVLNIGQFGVKTSTGFGNIVLSAINTIIEAGATATPGSAALLPTTLQFQNVNQAGATANAMVITSSGNVGIGVASPVYGLDVLGSVHTSSAAFVGVTIATQTAGGAGSSVTATCPNTTFALGGGCNCSGGVAITGNLSTPNVVTAGGIATGWTCQEPGGTGGACSAYAICSRLQ